MESGCRPKGGRHGCRCGNAPVGRHGELVPTIKTSSPSPIFAKDGENWAEYEAFVRTAWDNAVNHTKGRALPQERFLLLKDADGNKHTLFSQSIRHIYKHHGDEASERKRRQIAIKETDLLSIPDIITHYSYKITGITYKGKPTAIYAKYGEDNTFIYIEDIGASNNYTPSTFFNLHTIKTADALIKILENNKLYDISGDLIIAGDGGGGKSSDTAMDEPRQTAATSVNPADT